MVPLLVPLGLFFAFVLVVAQLARLASNISLNRTLREALRSDPASVPILAERLDARQPWADSLVGWIFIAFAVGLVLMALFEPAFAERRRIVQSAIVPLVVGGVILFYLRRAKKAATDDMAGIATEARRKAPRKPAAGSARAR